MNCILTIDGVTINNSASIRIFKKLFPQNHLTTILFEDVGGVTSLRFPKETTINRAVTLTDEAGHYLFRGFVVDLLPKADQNQQLFEMVCAGEWYQFSQQVITLNAACGVPHIYEAHEGIEPDEPADYNVTGIANKVGVGDGLAHNTELEDTNKAWGVNDWVSGAPNRYGLIILKNMFRPAESYTDTNATYISGTIENTRTNDDTYLEFYSNVADADVILHCYTKIARANITRLKVRTVIYNQYAFNAASYGYIYIYNWQTPGWDILQTMSQAARTYNSIYEHTETGALLEADGAVNKYVSAAGEIKIRYLGGDSGIVGTIFHWIKIFFLRVELVVTDYPSLQFTIASNTANVISCGEDLDVAGVEFFDFYVIGQLSSWLLNYLITTYDTWQALTTTNITAGAYYFMKNWDYNYLPIILRELIEIEKYDAWIDDANDLHTQTSGSATATGLTFSETTPNLQVLGFQGGAIGSQIKNRIIVQWANGIVTVNGFGSQTTYLYVMTELYVDKSIKSSEDATRYANYLLSRYQTPHLDLAVSMSQYVYLQVGQSIIVNFPSRNITNETYLIRELQYYFTNDKTNILVTLAKGGSAIHRYQTEAEEKQLLKNEVLRIQQQLSPGVGSIGALVGSIPQISDEAYAAGWDGVTTIAPSKNAVYDEIVILLAAIAAKLANVVEDLTPQLGGDLDLNGHGLDFPTTANITDVLDEDNMASDSATKLCTQQSIKAYVDAISPDLQMIITSYQNTGGLGFAIGTYGFGAGYAVACSDTNAEVRYNFHITTADDFKVRIYYSCDSANVGKTASGVLSIRSTVDGEDLATANIANAVNCDLALDNTANKQTSKESAAYALAAGDEVGVKWAKDDNAGGAAGNLWIVGIVLVRQ